jgi:predicted MarR family transcription regulator
MTLTPRQLLIALHIRAGHVKVRDLRAAVGLRSINTVDYHKGKLRDKGLVTWTPGRAATLELTECGRQAIRGYILLPCGGVGAWQPVEEPTPAETQES